METRQRLKNRRPQTLLAEKNPAILMTKKQAAVRKNCMTPVPIAVLRQIPFPFNMARTQDKHHILPLQFEMVVMVYRNWILRSSSREGCKKGLPRRY